MIRISVMIAAISMVAAAGLRALNSFIELAWSRISTAEAVGYVVGTLIGTLLSLGVIIGLVIVMFRFAGSIGDYQTSPTPKKLERVLETHQTYWTFWGVAVSVLLFLGLVFLLFVLAAPTMRAR